MRSRIWRGLVLHKFTVTTAFCFLIGMGCFLSTGIWAASSAPAVLPKPETVVSPFDEQHEAGQRGKYFGRPGKYSLIVRSEETSVGPGGTLVFQVFVSGYGKIKQAKFFAAPTSGVVDEAKSRVFYDIGYDEDHALIWGTTSRSFSEDGFTMGLHGVAWES